MIERVSVDLRPAPDGLRNPKAKPTWEQLSRLGGDRVAILFEDLRRRVGAIEGVVEDMRFAGREEGWAPSYSAGERELFTVRIVPGRLEGVLRVGERERAALLARCSTSAAAKRALASGRSAAGESEARWVLKNASDVRSFAGLAARLSRLSDQR
jgi:hypothetical protein